MEQGILLNYQRKWKEDTSDFKIMEKSRRIGGSWGESADNTLYASSESGGDVWYIGYSKEMALDYMEDCKFWAGVFDLAAGAMSEEIFDDRDKDILTYVIKFASGYKIRALSSTPRNLRGKGKNNPVVFIDEAAFHDDLEKLLESAVALTMWGGKIRIVSTHYGVDNYFNTIIEEIRAGKREGALHTYDLNHAINDGLYRRICEINKIEWSKELENSWKNKLISRYGDSADQELFCKPDKGDELYFSRSLITKCMSENIPVIRLEKNDSFGEKPEAKRRKEIDNWLYDNILYLLDEIEDLPSYIGEDFARNRNVTSIFILYERKDTSLYMPFFLELWNIPFRQQEQIIFFVIDRLKRFCGACLDAGGNGAQLAEAVKDRYGSSRVLEVKLSDKWYGEWMPVYKAAYEDQNITIAKDSDILDDHRTVKKIKGIPKIVTSQKSKGDKQRHGDSVIAGALAVSAVNIFFSGDRSIISTLKREALKYERF